MRRTGGAALMLILLAAALAGATTSHREDVTVSPAALAPRVTLGAGATGTTTLGSSLASATTTKSGVIALGQEVLQIKKGTGDWDTRMNLVSATGFGTLDSVTVKEILGATTQPQVIVALGVVTQTTGTAINLLASGSDISLTLSGTKVSSGSSVLTMQVIMTPHSGTQPTITYSYTLTIT